MTDKEKQMFDRLEEQHNIQLELAVEYGYRGCEKGWNKERTIQEFWKLLKHGVQQ